MDPCTDLSRSLGKVVYHFKPRCSELIRYHKNWKNDDFTEFSISSSVPGVTRYVWSRLCTHRNGSCQAHQLSAIQVVTGAGRMMSPSQGRSGVVCSVNPNVRQQISGFCPFISFEGLGTMRQTKNKKKNNQRYEKRPVLRKMEKLACVLYPSSISTCRHVLRNWIERIKQRGPHA